MDVLMIVIGIFTAAGFLRICGRQKKPIKAMAVNSGAGLVLLILTAVITGYLGCGLSVNYVSVFTASVLGVPGEIMLLLIAFVI